MSVSTVRRYEGTRLKPVITDKGVRMFTVEQVERLAAALAADQSTPRGMQKAAVNVAQLSKGELAAAVFERLEQRHSLVEIVVALRVPPDEVRDLYHAWLIGLWAGELQRDEPALPPCRTEQDVIRRVAPEKLSRMLGALPSGEPTRISLRALTRRVDHQRRRQDVRGVSKPRRARRLRRVRADRDLADHRARRRWRVSDQRVRLSAARSALGGVGSVERRRIGERRRAKQLDVRRRVVCGAYEGARGDYLG